MAPRWPGSGPRRRWGWGSWRRTWGRDIPFYFVQIAPWGNTRYADGELPAELESISF